MGWSPALAAGTARGGERAARARHDPIFLKIGVGALGFLGAGRYTTAVGANLRLALLGYARMSVSFHEARRVGARID